MGLYFKIEGGIVIKNRTKKCLYFAITFCFIIGCFSVLAYVSKEKAATETRGVVSLADLAQDHEKTEAELMTFDEMVNDIAAKHDMTYEEALATLPKEVRDDQTRKDIGYIARSVTLEVTDAYKPYIEFYCRIAYDGNLFNILSIYNLELVRQGYDSTLSKQFNGTLKVWLRSGQKIEYAINGDFYNDGTTTSKGGIGVNAGIDQSTAVLFTISPSTTNIHYKYFYKHGYYCA